MLKIAEKLMIFGISFFFITGLSAVAFASNNVDHNFTLQITDRTNGEFSEDISVTLLSADALIEYNYTITSENYCSGDRIISTIEPATYHIAISFPSKGEFVVKNPDESNIDMITIRAGESISLDWMILAANKTTSADISDHPIVKLYTVDTGNSEADLLWKEFITAIFPTTTDAKYNHILSYASTYSAQNAMYYFETTGRDRKEYLQMPTFEKFLWYATYIEPSLAISGDGKDFHTASLENWFKNGLRISHYQISSEGTNEMETAYEALMEWMYYYVLEHNEIYCFLSEEIRNKSTTNTEEDIVTESIGKNNDTSSKPESEHIDTIDNATLEQSDDVQIKELEGAPTNNHGIADKDISEGGQRPTVSAAAFIIPVVLAGAGSYVIRKKKH